VDPGERSEPSVLRSLEDGRYLTTHILHFDPFAFVMDPEDATRELYLRLVRGCDEHVHLGRLGAASVFFTWGSNSAAALADLSGPGYRGGLPGGYQSLLGAVAPSRRIVITWCWSFYFSLLLIVPEVVRDDLAVRLKGYADPFRPRLSTMEIV